MRYYRLARVMVFILSIFLGSVAPVRAANSDVIINEIMAYSTATADEWVELFNRGSVPVDLNGWVFYENATRHGIKSATGATVLLPGAYAIIAENSTTFAAKYGAINSLLFDSSWSTGLASGGEQIGLKDASDSFLELFTYPPSTHASLERADAFSSASSSATWLERPSGDSAGQVNAVSLLSSSSGGSTSPTTTPVSSVPTSATPTSTLWAALRLNEISPVPSSGSEWVELYNPSSESFDLAGGTLCDNRATSCAIASVSGSISAHGFLVVNIFGSKLNNDGDSVVLKNPAGDVVDQFTYGGAVLPASGQVLERTVDGAGSWAVSVVSTMGNANVVSAPPVTGVTGVITPGSSDETAQDNPLISANGSKGIIWYATSTAPLRITELFPNPDGDDTRDEFIECMNQSDEVVDLSGWKLSVDGAFFNLSGQLDSGDPLVLRRSTTHLELKNTTSSIVRFLSPDLAIASEATYPHPAPSGLSYTEISPGHWGWFKPTPHSATSTTAGIMWQLSVPRSALINEPVSLGLGSTADPRGGTWSALWTIDGHKKTGSNITVSFTTSGVHSIAVNATSTMGTVGATQAELLVTEDGVPGSGNVHLSEIFTHPSDPETEEFIEIVNDEPRAVRLDGWHLSTKSGKTYSIPDETVLPSGGILVFYQSVTNLNLADSGEIVRLMNSAGTVVDRRVVPKTPEDESYQLIDGVWRVFPARSPGRLLSFPDGTGGGEETSLVTPVTKTTSKKSTTKKVTAGKKSKKSAALSVVSLSDINGLAKSSLVQTDGIVVALPGAFGAQYAAIATDDGGVLVYQNQKNFPPLNYGDRIRITGTISETSGRKRVNVAQESDIDILSTNNTLDPSDVQLSDLSDADVGKLVVVHGELTSKTTAHGFIDDGTDELPFTIKSGVKLSTKTWPIGAHLALTGVVVANAKGFELWPRRPEDAVVEAASSSARAPSSSADFITSSAGSSLPNVYPVIIGGLLLTNAGLLWQLYRGRAANSKT